MEKLKNKSIYISSSSWQDDKFRDFVNVLLTTRLLFQYCYRVVVILMKSPHKHFQVCLVISIY